MANEYTSVATTPGLATNLVKAAYDLAVKEALRAHPTMRDFVTIRPDQPAHRGSSVTMNRFNWFADAAVTAAKTPLSEEADVDSTKIPATTPVTITPNEYGFAVTSTEKLNNRTFAPFDGFKARAIADHQGRVLDSLIQDALVAGSTALTVTGTAENLLTAANKLSSTFIRKQVTALRVGNVPTWDGQFYVAAIHPHVAHDIREEAGSGGWRVPKEYQNEGLLINGELGEWEGVRFVQNNLIRHAAAGASSAETYQTYFFGQGGFAEHVVVEPEVRVGPSVDKLGRFATLGWYGDLGWAVYEPLAIRRVVSSSSLEAEA